ncbi:hypothetical protein CA51_40920 [Rosistilla oblonga]|nr:hypothetical protein CA51_40920 [Rosistilla oblonga]
MPDDETAEASSRMQDPACVTVATAHTASFKRWNGKANGRWGFGLLRIANDLKQTSKPLVCVALFATSGKRCGVGWD